MAVVVSFAVVLYSEEWSRSTKSKSDRFVLLFSVEQMQKREASLQ